MKSYPAYKESGIEWIGEIPEHWTKRQLKHVSSTQPSNVDKKSKEDEKEVFLCNYVDVYKNEFITDDIAFMKATASDSQIQKFTLKQGDVLVTKDSEDPKDIAIPALVNKNYDNVVCGYHLTRIRAEGELSGRYIFRILQAQPFNTYFEVNAKGVTRYGLGTETFLNFETLLPPLEEQTAIAHFLDHKTAQIDGSIEKRRELIVLLQEHRSALINEAVTKGINPHTPMKDSGIEWIGEIPEHWEVKKLKHLAIVQPSNVDKKSKEDEKEVFLCNYVDVYKNEFINDDIIFMKATASKSQIDRFSLEKGDVLLTKDSEDPNDIAIPALIAKDLPNVVCGYHLTMVRPLENLIGEFLFRLFQANSFNVHFRVNARGITRYGLSVSAFTNVSIPYPDTSEQQQIVDFIEAETSRIDEEVTLAQQEIDLLEEYRQSLIAEAVTGKIDVRDYTLN